MPAAPKKDIRLEIGYAIFLIFHRRTSVYLPIFLRKWVGSKRKRYGILLARSKIGCRRRQERMFCGGCLYITWKVFLKSVKKEVDNMKYNAIIFTDRQTDRIILSAFAAPKRIAQLFKACFARGISMDVTRLFALP